MAVARVHTAAEGDVAAAHPYAGRLCGLCQVGAVVWATDAGFRIRGHGPDVAHTTPSLKNMAVFKLTIIQNSTNITEHRVVPGTTYQVQ